MNDSYARRAGWPSNTPASTHVTAPPKGPAAAQRSRRPRGTYVHSVTAAADAGATSGERMRLGMVELAPFPRRPRSRMGRMRILSGQMAVPSEWKDLKRASASEPGGGALARRRSRGPGCHSGISANPICLAF